MRSYDSSRASLAMPAPVQGPATGSLYSTARYRPALADPRARLVGDIVTIRISEKVSASQNSSSNVNRKSGAGGGITALPFVGGNLADRTKIGAEITSEVIAGHAELAWYFLPLKFIGQLGTFLTGLPGGIFAPSLSLGAGIGSWFVPLFDPELKIKLIAIGMVAALAAITRAPLTSAIILMEMTDGHDMVISIMAAAMISASVARIFKTNLYHDLAEQVLANLRNTQPTLAKKRSENE